jgi:ABC-type sugar transport system substrate-binding protein
MLVPIDAGNAFWVKFEYAMTLAAKQLDIELSIDKMVYSEHNRFATTARFEKIAKSKSKPDYFISLLQSHAELEALNIFEENKLKFISVNTGLDKKIIPSLGRPQKDRQYWIGHVSPDDYQAGEGLMTALLQEAHARKKLANDNSVISALAFSGPARSLVAEQRLAGLQLAMNKTPNAILLQYIYTPWIGEEVDAKIAGLINRHGIPDVIWAVSDGIALQASEIIKGHQHANPLFGGIDWSDAGIAGLQDKALDVSIGGHFFDGAWALVLAKDHAEGHILSESDSGIYLSNMSAITRQNLAEYHILLNEAFWPRFDFTQFSKTYNPELVKNGYNFRITKALLDNK